MIQANELRIGNYVHHNERNYLSSHLDSYLTVCELTEKSITTFYHSCHGGIQVVRNKKDYQPIPLTEEWLLRFGFEKKRMFPIGVQDDRTTYTLWLENSDAYFYKDSNFGELGCYASDGGDASTIVKNIDYVHQLQNLYFALTGEELTIKEQ